jgi:hypothetical protein
MVDGGRGGMGSIAFVIDRPASLFNDCYLFPMRDSNSEGEVSLGGVNIGAVGALVDLDDSGTGDALSA